KARTYSRLAVSAAGLLIAAAFLMWGRQPQAALPANAGAVDQWLAQRSGATDEKFAFDEEMARNWPQFPGPTGGRASFETNVPNSWDLQSGTGVAWKAAVPAPGYNSPIVWGDHIFLSGGDSTKREVFCFDLQRGDLLWERAVVSADLAPPQ